MTTTGNPTPRARQRDRDPGRDFVVGGVIPLERGEYLNRGADDALFRMAVSGEYAHVLAGRQSGKSSLTARVAQRLRDRDHLVAVVDVSQIGQRQDQVDSARWFYSFAFRLVRQLRIRIDLQEWWQDKSNLTIRQRLTELYWDVILTNTRGPVTIFVDSPAPLHSLPVAEELLASIAAVHNARAAEPELDRLNFIVLSVGEPDRTNDATNLSLLTGSQRLDLQPFTLDELRPLQARLNLPAQAAAKAIQRIHFWTGGQPFLTMKLARSIARRSDQATDINVLIDDCVRQLFAHPGVLHSEPHLNALQHALLFETKAREKTLAMYGRIRKGTRVRYEPESLIHRNLLGEGLLKVASDQTLVVANRIYALAFPTRWANEHLRMDFRTAAAVLAVIALVFVLPVWYTQIFPGRWVGRIQNPVELSDATDAHERMRAWPGHRRSANQLLVSTLTRGSKASNDMAEAREYDRLLRELPGATSTANELMAEFHDRTAIVFESQARRDHALMARLNALSVPSERRQNAALALISGDYAYLQASIRLPATVSDVVLNDTADKLVALAGLELRQFLLGATEPVLVAPWQVSALRVYPQVARVSVTGQRAAGRIGLELTLAHDRVSDLEFRLTSPTGRSVRILGGELRRVEGQVWRITLAGSPVLAELKDVQRAGNWTLSVADRQPGIAGQLLGWDLQFRANQHFSSLDGPLSIRDPEPNYDATARLSPSARYAVALPSGQDSMAQVWEVGNQQAVSAFPFGEGDQVLGFVLDERVILVQTHAGVRAWTLATGEASWSPADAGSLAISRLSANRQFLALTAPNDETGVRVYDLIEEQETGRLTTSGNHAAVALSNDGLWVALADPDRTVRLWQLGVDKPIAEFAVAAAVIDLQFDAEQQQLAIRTADKSLSLYALNDPSEPLSVFSGRGDWQLTFDPAGDFSVAGNARQGYQVFDPALTRARSPLFRPDGQGASYIVQTTRTALLLYSPIEQQAKVFRLTDLGPDVSGSRTIHQAALAPDGRLIAIENQPGQVRIERVDALSSSAADSSSLGFVGHNAPVISLGFSGNGSAVVSMADDGSIRVWDSDRGQPRKFFIRHSRGGARSVQISGDAEKVVVGDSAGVSLYSARTGELLSSRMMTSAVTAVAFTDNNESLLVGLQNGQLWKFSDDLAAEAAVSGAAAAPITAIANRLSDIAFTTAAGQLVVIQGANTEPAILDLGGETCSELYFDVRLVCRGAAWLRSIRLANGELTPQGGRLLPASPAFSGLAIRVDGVAVLTAAPSPVIRNLHWDHRDVVSTALSETEQALWRRRLSWQPTGSLIDPLPPGPQSSSAVTPPARRISP